MNVSSNNNATVAVDNHFNSNDNSNTISKSYGKNSNNNNSNSNNNNSNGKLKRRGKKQTNMYKHNNENSDNNEDNSDDVDITDDNIDDINDGEEKNDFNADIDDDDDDINDCDDDNIDDDVSEGSFPTTKDLASLAATAQHQQHALPESVSYLGQELGLNYCNSAASGGGSTVTGGASFGATSDTKSLNRQRSLSFCSDIERGSSAGVSNGAGGAGGAGGGCGIGSTATAVTRTTIGTGGMAIEMARGPVGGVMMASSIKLCHEPVVPYFAPFEAAKSDIATVCSNSVVEDIASDVASVGTIHSVATSTNIMSSQPQHSNFSISTATNVNIASFANAANAPSHTDMNHKKKKYDRRLEFASETVWKYKSNNSSNSSMSAATSQSVPLTKHALNDMGPPLNRSLLEKVGVSVGGTSSTGTTSRAGSVKSYGSQSQAASEVVHVDTDDCGDFSGLDENPSFQSIDNSSIGKFQQENTLTANKRDINDLLNASGDAHGGESGDIIMGDTQNKVVSLHTLNECCQNGRVSPGGTKYIGSGVRKYQSRYMHLPLKRFQQNGATLPEPETNDWKSHRSWQGTRSRSRSRSRDRDMNHDTSRWNRKNNSNSPPSRSVNSNRSSNEGGERGRSGNGGRWKYNRRNNNEGSSNQRYKYTNGTRRGGWHGSNNSNNWGSHKMTPRDPKHRDIKKRNP